MKNKEKQAKHMVNLSPAEKTVFKTVSGQNLFTRLLNITMPSRKRSNAYGYASLQPQPPMEKYDGI